MRLLVVGVLLLAAGSVVSSMLQIQPGERAVVRRFGRILEDKPGPGLHFVLPWGMDQVAIVKVNQVREVTVGHPLWETDDERATPPGQLLTGDHNLINLQVKLYYTVKDEPRELEKYVLGADRVESLLERVAENALAEWVAGRTVEGVLLRGKREIPDWLMAEVQRRIDAYDLGVAIGPPPSVTHLNPPREVKAAFDAVTQAEAVADTRLNRAKQFAKNRESQAQIELYDSQKRTQTYQNQKKLQAQAEIEVFERELELAARSEHYKVARWWNALGRIYTRLKENGRVEPLDHYLTPEGLNITQSPWGPRKK